jgi:hypothetical protein
MRLNHHESEKDLCFISDINLLLLLFPHVPRQSNKKLTIECIHHSPQHAMTVHSRMH